MYCQQTGFLEGKHLYKVWFQVILGQMVLFCVLEVGVSFLFLLLTGASGGKEQTHGWYFPILEKIFFSYFLLMFKIVITFHPLFPPH